HSRPANRALGYGLSGLWGFQHHAVAQVDSDVVIATRAIENQVAAFHLLRTNALVLVVLVASKVRQRDSHASKGVDHQTSAFATDLVVVTEGIGNASVANTLGRTIRIAAAPSIRHADLRLSTCDDRFDLLAAGGIAKLCCRGLFHGTCSRQIF